MGSPNRPLPRKVSTLPSILPMDFKWINDSDRAENAGSVEDRTRRFDGIVGKAIDRWNFTLNQVEGGLNFEGFLKLIGADRVGDYIRIIPHKPTSLFSY